MSDPLDTLSLHQQDIKGLPLFTPKEERRAALRVQAARRRYHLAALRLDHVARTAAAVLARARDGDLTLQRHCRLAATELLPPARVKELSGDALAAACKAATLARLRSHLPLVDALLDRARRQPERADAARRKAARLLEEVGVVTAKLDGLVAEAAALPPEPQGETAASLAAAVGLARRRRAYYDRCRAAMARGNLGLVWHVAKASARSRDQYADLIQDGYTGLMRAVDKFQPGMGFRFSTHAVSWIKQAVRKAIGDHGRTVRVPGHTREIAGQVYWARAQLAGLTDGEPTYEQIVAHIKATRNKTYSADEARRADAAVKPIAGFEDEGGEDVAAQSLADDAAGAEEVVLSADAARAVTSALGVLPFRQRAVVQLRYGLGDGWRYGLTEVGRIFGISWQAAQQLQQRALAALRQPAVMELLAGYD